MSEKNQSNRLFYQLLGLMVLGTIMIALGQLIHFILLWLGGISLMLGCLIFGALMSKYPASLQRSLFWKTVGIMFLLGLAGAFWFGFTANNLFELAIISTGFALVGALFLFLQKPK